MNRAKDCRREDREMDAALIILIDGSKLAEYMIDHGVGVTTEATYELKRIDSDYFARGMTHT